MVKRETISWWLARITYPVLWAGVLTAIWLGLNNPSMLSYIAGVKGAVTVGLLLTLEYVFPLDHRWRMTGRLFLRRDLVMLIGNGLTAGVLNYLLLILALDAAQSWHGAMTGQAIWLQVLVGLLVFEALQYSLHRFMHADNGPLARFLWRCHAIHHLPQQLYVIMHAVFHPVNLLLVRVIVQLTPIWLLGFDPMAVFIYGSVIGLHGAISHFNFDLRMGLFNYLFVGPELHRYHHSAQSHEAVNFGAALSVYDLLFNTFKYTPGQYPDNLGLSEADGYPGQTAPMSAMLFPFVPAQTKRSSAPDHVNR